MPRPVTVAVDVMGGDLGPRLVVLACLEFASVHPDIRVIIVGDQQHPGLMLDTPPENIEFVHATSVVSMADKPTVAVRKKNDSSMAVALECVASKRADACVSAGNTGAYMAFGLLKLGTLAGIDRPAICKAVPSGGGKCYLLDLGANIECTPKMLLQFARLGVAMAKSSGIGLPRVGVLNVGVEDNKGHLLQRETLELLKQTDLNVVGFIEGDGIYKAQADVVVCDGFTGNAVLKASEGAVGLLRHSLADAGANLSREMQYQLRSWFNEFDPEQFNGAALLGLDGIVVKSHGSASSSGFLAALEVAANLVICRFIDSVQASLAVR